MEPQTPYAHVTPEAVLQKMERVDPVVLVDVRTPAEYARHHIPGVLLIPLDEFAARVGEVDRGAEVVCLCEHGVRSEAAAQYLSSVGHRNVATMTGGMAAYPGPVEAGD